jgi:hypothetical protein
MIEKNTPVPEKQQQASRSNRLKEIIKGFLAAVVDSRYGFGFILPMTEDGKSFKDHGLEGLGYRKNADGNVEKIPDSKIK